MSCKHEEEIIKYLGDRFFTCVTCGKRFEYDEVVILPKETHDLTQAVVRNVAINAPWVFHDTGNYCFFCGKQDRKHVSNCAYLKAKALAVQQSEKE